MAIYVYPPVSLSITSGPTSFVKDGATVTVNEDTGTPANSRPLPIKVLDGSGVEVGLATEAKQDVGNTSLSSIDAELVNLNAKDFATSAKQDALLAELQLKADLTETQPVSLAAVPLPAGAATEATLALIKAKTDNLDVAQSTRASEATLALIKAKTDNIDVASSTLAKDSTLIANGVLTGAVNEAAPASDTASSGLNGRLQRIAQRLTSIIALLPAALGQGTMAQSLRVVIASDQSAVSTSSTPVSVAGTITQSVETVGTTRSRATVGAVAPSASRKKLTLKPSASNTGKIFLGGSTVTIANGQEIIGPDLREFNFDSGDYYLISDTAGQSVEIIEKV